MDQVVARALMLFDQRIANKSGNAE
jgi:hypothetical protein